MTALQKFLKQIILKRVKGSVYLVPAICDFQIEEALEEERKQGQTLPLDSVSVSSVSYDEAEEFLQSKDIFHHPYVIDRTDSNSYELADLLVEFFNTINSR
jgi:hypothetical protein